MPDFFRGLPGHEEITIVSARSVDCGFRTEVYITVECTYLKYLQGGRAAPLYYAIGMCVAVRKSE